MTEQIEALRLADALDAHQFDEPHAAATELRRLVVQRDALLEALEKMVAVYSGQVQNDGGYTVLDSVRPLITDQAAIAQTEGA